MKHALSRLRNRQIAEAVRGGLTAAEAAERFGCSLPTARNACGAHGVRPPRGPRWSRMPERTYRVVSRLCNSDATLADVAREFNLTRERVSQIYSLALDAGVPVRKRARGRKLG